MSIVCVLLFYVNISSLLGSYFFICTEGFTVFVERKIIGRMYGEQEAALHASIGWNKLTTAVGHYGCHHEFTQLHVPLDGGTDPDDAFSAIPYEKGFNFLYYLQNVVGGE